MDRHTSNGLMGALAGIFTTAILQPLENIKMAMMIPPKDLTLGPNILHNLLTTKVYILEKEGVQGYFKGMVAASMRAGAGSFLYFEILRSLQKHGDNDIKHHDNFRNSLLARMISTFVTNPLAIVETRYELANFHGYTSIIDAFRKITKYQGLNTFFKGAYVSCLKEGIFAGFYYMLYQHFKDLGIGRFGAGILSGLISTAASHPLEIVRARLQTEGIRNLSKTTPKHTSLSKEFQYMFTNGGWLKGLTPRLFKKPLANTITFCIFEMLEERRDEQLLKKEKP